MLIPLVQVSLCQFCEFVLCLGSRQKGGYDTIWMWLNCYPRPLQMNRGMIRGYEVIVQPAGDENHFVELAGEAASNPWAVIGTYTL